MRGIASSIYNLRENKVRNLRFPTTLPYREPAVKHIWCDLTFLTYYVGGYGLLTEAFTEVMQQIVGI